MIHSRHVLLTTLLALVFSPATHAQAQEPIRFARTPDISPDGKLIAFSYLGDIWVVEAIGGVARPVTMHAAHDFCPVFSPDGRTIAFASNRHGNYDVFTVPVQGGKPTRLTTDSADDMPTGWSPDGRSVLITSARSNFFPPALELYTVPASGGRATRVSAHEGREGAFSPTGDRIAYARGAGTWYRKGYRGSSNDDLWICNVDGSGNRRFTTHNGQDNYPMWSPDGRHLYYVSDCCNPAPGGVANIVRQDVAVDPGSGAKPTQITFHKEDSVRRARISANGEWIVYECGPDIWVTSTRGGSGAAGHPTGPRKLAIEVHADEKVNAEKHLTFTQGATEFSVSHDDRHIAFVVHGEIFLLARGGGKAKRLTDSPAYDHGIAWSPDSRQLIFLSDRGGQEDVYLLQPDDPDHPELVKAHQFKVKQLTNTPEAEAGLNFSPDGRRISFIRAGRLVTMNPDGTDVKVIVDEGTVIDYEWSPDAKWIVYSRMDGSWASELYIIPATGATKADPARNITRYATFNAGVTWSRTGNKLAFLGERRGGAELLHVLSLQKPAAPGAPPSAEIDWDDVHLRSKELAPFPAQDAAINRDGSRVAFRGAQAGDDLWVVDTDGKNLTRLTNGNMKPRQIQWSRGAMSSLLYFLDGNGQIRMLSTLQPGSAPPVPFTAKMTVRRDELFTEMFDQAWRALHENFYDVSFHGADWKAVRDRYRPLLQHVTMREDLYALGSLMLGELNASHVGIFGPQSPQEQVTADLGLLFDEKYRGPGLKVTEVLKRGPADQRGIALKPGDVIESIDRVALTDKVELASVLNDKAGETVVLHVAANAAAGLPKRRIELQAVPRTALRPLMYDRWVDANARRVAELSKGKLGYIHIPSMDEDGLSRFLRSLYSDNFDKEAIVLDVRYNGGGFTHDKVLNYLGGRAHTFFLQRHGGVGPVLRSADRKWQKPLVLLMNNRSYSDAEILPHAFRAAGLGKLVGEPTGGNVIGTTRIRLIDGSMFLVPRTGVYTAGGVNMEKEGVRPDFVVEPHPDEVARGIDRQLEKAVEVLEQDVVLWKKTKPGVAFNPASLPGSGGAPVVSPSPAPPGPAPAPPGSDSRKE